ncbi:MAG: cobalt ECF transporter T component CbiQ [Planctomycetes bacterium]|nr:cobalt ECF transporter T component CbiQ [Planctomycetota bacterium]
MSSSYLARYGRSKSICHRLPARLKIVLTLAVVAAGISIPVELWPIQGVLACLVFAGHSFARIPMTYLLRRLAIFLPMLLLLSISLPATQGFSAAGWEIMASILFGSTLAFISLLWLVNVMPFDQLLHTLRQLWVPDVLVATLSFMYRYIFVLWNELEKMRTARKARTFGSGGFWFRWKTSAEMIGMLLIRAMERAERVHGAMCARGWDGRVRTLEEQSLPIRKR